VDEAVVFALEAELKRNEMQVQSPVQLRSPEEQARVRAALRAIQAQALALSKPGGRDLTKDEIDTLWGHE
jgi:hypothetical protein